MRTRTRDAKALLIASAALLMATPALGQRNVNPSLISGGNHASANGFRGVIVVGRGVTGRSSDNAGNTGVHCVGGCPGIRDVAPPVIDAIDNLTPSADGAGCVATVDLPAVRVTDNRDANPGVTVTLQTNPPQNIDPAGEQVELQLGSYDVLIVAVDQAGNEARASYRVDVTDRTPPVIVDLPDPTPAGEEAEAESPAGTAVELEITCRDACDADPVGALDPERARFPVGDTTVRATCRDDQNNTVTENIIVRVRDTTPPSLANQPEAISRACNQPGGARIDVPQVVWSDNGSNVQDLTTSLVVNPGTPREQVFQDIPQEIEVTPGDNVLRYIAVDEAENERAFDLAVEIVDEGAPSLEIIEAPENGWSNEDQVSITLRIADGCSIIENACPGDQGGEGDLDIDFQPPPAGCSVEGDEVTLVYDREGAVNLVVQVEDQVGNRASDSSVRFGIDRNAPEPTIVVPSQVGVDPEDPLTVELFARAEFLNLNVGGEDPADGNPSGIRRVRVSMATEGRNARIIADHQVEGNGNPAVGARAIRGIGCLNDDDVTCTGDFAVSLRDVPEGLVTLNVTVEDFAGNETSREAVFYNLDLHDGAQQLIARMGDIIQNGDPGDARDGLVAASRSLVEVRDLTGLGIQGSPHETPLFLGAALVAAQSATIQLGQARENAAGVVGTRIDDALEALQRLGASDVELMHAYSMSRNRAGEPDFLQEAYETDVDILERALDAAGQAIDAEQWNQAASNIVLAYFHTKSALTGWMMDYDFLPNAEDAAAIRAEYVRGRDILAEIRDELSLYLNLNAPPAEGQMARIRDRLNSVVGTLSDLIDEGFQIQPGGGGVTDREYFDALIELREVANVSTAAGNTGAYVRNYQFSMMQMVRFMTQASVEDAIFTFGAQRHTWPLYVRARQLIEQGIDLIDNRRVQSVIDLYGRDIDAVCLTFSVYHCEYIRDEGDNDDDPVLAAEDIPEACLDHLLLPDEWEGVEPDGNILAQCQYEPAGGEE